MFDLPDEWFENGLDPELLEEHAIRMDRWDQVDLARSASQITEFETARKQLAEFVDTGQPAMNDTFTMLFKARPHQKDVGEMKPTHLVNHRVITQANELQELQQARRFSVGDDVQAALMAATLEPDLETLFDKTERSRKQAEEMQKALQDLAAANRDAEQAQRDLDEMIREWSGQEDGDEDGAGDGDGEETQGGGGDNDDGDGEGDAGAEGDGSGGDPGSSAANGPHRGGGSSSQSGGQQPPGDLTPQQEQALDDAAKKIREAQERAEEARGRAREAETQMNEMAQRESADVRAILQQGLSKSVDEAQTFQANAKAWGLEPGELKKMPADERMELARKLNTDRMKQIASLFGPMWNLFVSEQSRRTPDARDELNDVETGDDLSRILASELLFLDDEDAEWEFLHRYAEHALLQYRYDGTEKLAKGAIIYCLDCSGSMMGDRELWAKAIMLVLLHHAKIQNRQMHVINFGSPNQFSVVSFLQRSDFTFERLVDVAESVWFGGTDFVTPMKQGLRILDEEFTSTGKVTADVVFVTDDECWVDDEFMKFYLEEMVRMSATTWGVSVSGADVRDGALSRMSSDSNHPTGKVATIRDFLTGNDIRAMFRGV